jgi:hypothetical protein
VFVLLVVLGSSISVTSAVGSASTTTLDPTLEQLVEADDPAAYAETHGLAYRNGSVRVVIELGPNATVPDDYDIDIEQEYRGPQQTLVQAYVPLQQLRPLAADPAVDYVRPPERGVADGTPEAQSTPSSPTPANTATQTSVTDTGQQQWFSPWLLISLVVPLAALILIVRLKKGEH